MSPASDRDEARRRRAEARQRRRGEVEAGQGDAGQPEPESSSANGARDTSADEAAAPGSTEPRSAARVAAAGAAVGAALGAARAFTGRGSEHHESEHHESEHYEDGDDAAAEPASGDAGDGDAVDDVTATGTAPARPAESEQARPGERNRIEGASPQETSDVVRRAREQLAALQGREPESISSLERTANGWTATFEVVELERVPDSTDVLASYEVVLDEHKNITRYARVRRYYRSQADREGG